MTKVSAVSKGIRGVMMILSPAKTLDLSPMDHARLKALPATTLPDCSPERTLEIAEAMKRRNQDQLGKLLGISKNLSKTAAGYWGEFAKHDAKASQLKPCIFAFSGAAYQGLKAEECSDAAISYLQDNLRIVDPLYGLLRPMDQIQPYRLEMATKKVLEHEEKLKLADYWRGSVTEQLNKDMSPEGGLLLNLASDEYAAAVDADELSEQTQYVKVVFQEEGRVVAVHAKRARGLMVRYLAENKVVGLDGVRKFSAEGYSFARSKSDDTTIVFDRKKQGTKRASTAASASKTGKRSRR